MSKDLFFEMRAERINELYDDKLTKKQAVINGKIFVEKIVSEGNVDKIECMAQIVRMQAVIDSAVNEMRKYLPNENFKYKGVEFCPVSGGETLNYKEDSIYNTLLEEVEYRKDILKIAQKQTVIDAWGNQVPKVGTTNRKSSISIKF